MTSAKNNTQRSLPAVTLKDLPPSDTKRWVIRRKAQVIAGVRAGLLTREDACARYQISAEEFDHWSQLVGSHGLKGLRTTRLGQYRQRSAPAL